MNSGLPDNDTFLCSVASPHRRTSSSAAQASEHVAPKNSQDPPPRTPQTGEQPMPWRQVPPSTVTLDPPISSIGVLGDPGHIFKPALPKDSHSFIPEDLPKQATGARATGGSRVRPESLGSGFGGSRLDAARDTSEAPCNDDAAPDPEAGHSVGSAPACNLAVLSDSRESKEVPLCATMPPSLADSQSELVDNQSSRALGVSRSDPLGLLGSHAPVHLPLASNLGRLQAAGGAEHTAGIAGTAQHGQHELPYSLLIGAQDRRSSILSDCQDGRYAESAPEPESADSPGGLKARSAEQRSAVLSAIHRSLRKQMSHADPRSQSSEADLSPDAVLSSKPESQELSRPAAARAVPSSSPQRRSAPAQHASSDSPFASEAAAGTSQLPVKQWSPPSSLASEAAAGKALPTVRHESPGRQPASEAAAGKTRQPAELPVVAADRPGNCCNSPVLYEYRALVFVLYHVAVSIQFGPSVAVVGTAVHLFFRLIQGDAFKDIQAGIFIQGYLFKDKNCLVCKSPVYSKIFIQRHLFKNTHSRTLAQGY